MSSPTPNPSPASPSPTPAGADQEWTLRYRLLDHYPNFAYCDPDYYPIARVGGEQAKADDWWPRNNTTPEARAILAHNHYSEPLDAEQRLLQLVGLPVQRFFDNVSDEAAESIGVGKTGAGEDFI